MENEYTKPVLDLDHYRAPMSCETRTYQVTGLKPQGGRSRFKVLGFIVHRSRLLMSLTETNYEKSSVPSVKRRKPIARSKAQYPRNDLTSLSPVGEVESLAIPGTYYALAFTPGLMSEVLTRNGNISFNGRSWHAWRRG